MKLKVFMLALLVISCASPKEYVNGKVKGNGKITTKEIKVSDYSEIAMGSGINCPNNAGKKGIPTFNYSQSKGSGSLVVTTDENILPLLDINCSKGRLTITSKNNSKLEPTRLIVEGKSKGLTSLTVSGCMDFSLQSNLKGDQLYIKGSGSTDIYLNNSVQVDACELIISGSGDIYTDNLTAHTINCKVSGSGDISLKGNAEEGKFSVSGSGDLKAYDFPVKYLGATVSGSGDMQVNATHTLEARASGSGDIRYTGSASVDNRVSGSGSIKKGR